MSAIAMYTREDASLARVPSALRVQLPAYARELWRHHRYKVLYGGRGAARSWTVARTLLLRAMQKKTRVLCAREIQASLRDSVHQLLSDQIDLLHFQGFLITDRAIRHRNGSLFLFEGLRHNATKIKSLEGIDICWVEEAERISAESWRILIPTIRKAGSEIWVTFNPDQEDDATYQRLIVRSPPDAWVRKVGWQDNPWFPQELAAEKDYDYSVDAESADWIWGGNIRRVSDAQILKGKWVVEAFEVPTMVDAMGQTVPLWDGPYQGMDFGYGVDPNAAIRAWVFDDTLYVEHEGWKLQLETDDMAAQWMHDIPGFERYRTRADSARPDTISYVRRHGLPNVRPARKHAGSVEDGIAHLRHYRRIVVHPRCAHTIQECKLYSYKVDKRSGDVLPIIVDKHNHLIDSLRYALDPLIKPRRGARAIFVDLPDTRVCPVCESLLPDDGECPHCGAVVDLETGALWDATTHAAEADDALDDDAPRIDHRHVGRTELDHRAANGNGHGPGSTNGRDHGHDPESEPTPTTRLARLNAFRSLNDD